MSELDEDSLLGIPDKEDSVEVKEEKTDDTPDDPKDLDQPGDGPNGIAPTSMAIAPSAMMNGNTEAAASEHADSATPAPATVAAAASAGKKKDDTKRLEVDGMMTEFQKKLGKNWDKYRDLLTHFLIGRLSRHELQEELDVILDRSLIRMHNQFLLANLCNSLRDPPQNDQTERLTSWSRKRGRGDGTQKVKGDQQMAKLREEVLSLPARERKRIKAITRESGKKGYIPSTIINTRQAMLPRIPFVNDKDAKPKLGNTVTWTQDIIHAYQTQLATESYELPDPDHLRSRMTGIALEHGILGGLGTNVVEVIQTGLEYYLKGIIQQSLEMVRLRKDKEVVATAKDMSVVLETTPHIAVETSAPVYRLYNVMLQNDEEVERDKVVKKEVVNDKQELHGLLEGLLTEF